MILRNALYTMTIEAWEAKRDGLVALVEHLTLRAVITPALRRNLYDIIKHEPSTGAFGPFTVAMMHRAPRGVGACQKSSERFHEWANQADSRLGMVPRIAKIVEKIDARVEKGSTEASGEPALRLAKRIAGTRGDLRECDCPQRRYNNLHSRVASWIRTLYCSTFRSDHVKQ
jgi:hypothetical protein